MKKFNAFFFLCFFFQIANGQYIPINLEQKILSSDLIVEGEVLHQQTFLSEDGYILTKNTISLKKKFKGDEYSNQNIEIVTRGGVLGNNDETWTHLLNLEKGDYGIFFLKKEENFGERFFTVFSSGQGFLKFDYNRSTPIASDYLKTYTNIQFEIYDKIETLINSSLKVIKGGEEEEDRRNCLRVEINPTIKTLNGLESTLQLKISAAIQDEPIYLKDLKLSVSYNVEQLGQNIVSEGLVEAYSGNELSDTQYELQLEDIGTNVFEINLSSFASQDDFLLLDDFLKEILDIQINFPSNIFLPQFSVSESQTLENSTFVDPWTLVERRIDCIELDFPFELPACPIITGFTPDTVAAGVENISLNNVPGTITITGTNFGNPSAGYIKPHLSDILFNDVDSGWFPAAELEYISWNNSQIVVRVPTMRKTGGTSLSPGACTERIGIITTDFVTGDTCTAYSANQLYVKYGLFNDPWRDTIPNWEISSGVFLDTVIYGGKRRNLVNKNSTGGYNLLIEDFYTDTTKNNAAVEQATAALDVYRCGYKINVEIVNAPPATARIRRGTLPTGVAGTTFMRGDSGSTLCSSTTNEDSSINFFDVIVNEEVLDTIVLAGGLTFMFNLSDTIPGDTSVIKYIDFQRTMIHELGHAFQLRHTNNQGDIMLSGTVDSQPFNNFNRNLSPNDDSAVKHLYLLGKVGACSFGAMTDYVCLTHTTEVDNKKQKVIIFPNPAQNNINVKLEKEISNLRIQIINVNGVLVSEKKEIRSGKEFNIDFPNSITNGVYFLRLTGDNGRTSLVSKIIIQR